MADALDLGSSVERRAGSSPVPSTTIYIWAVSSVGRARDS